MATAFRFSGIVAVLLTVVTVADLGAQARSDSIAVIALSALQLLDDPPLKHPAGTTERFCLAELTRAAGRSFRAPAERHLSELGPYIADAARLQLTHGCRGVPAQTFGLWIVDEHAQAAVLLRVTAPVFDGPDSARVFVSTLRGGRWGVGRECHVARQEGSSQWEVIQCALHWRN